jgi:hypothetical protein
MLLISLTFYVVQFAPLGKIHKIVYPKNQPINLSSHEISKQL